MLSVPVVDKDQKPLMPTTPNRAAAWVKSRKATPFWKKGVWCVRLNVEPSDRITQPVACGIDPGSKKEAIVIVTAKKTLLNVQADAVAHVKKRVEQRRNARRARRGRKTPCRANRENRKRGGLPPSTLARWQWKIRLVNWLRKLFPITHYAVEDVKAKTKPGKKAWNRGFSPMAAGKQWFYDQLRQLGDLTTYEGWQTKEFRERRGLKKSTEKMSSSWDAHCVDGFVLASEVLGRSSAPDYTLVLGVTPLELHRRQLHAFQPAADGLRRQYGGTRSVGFKRGSLVRHSQRGVCYIGGASGGRISLHDLNSGRRLCQNARPTEIQFLSHSSWRWMAVQECG